MTTGRTNAKFFDSHRTITTTSKMAENYDEYVNETKVMDNTSTLEEYDEPEAILCTKYIIKE